MAHLTNFLTKTKDNHILLGLVLGLVFLLLAGGAYVITQQQQGLSQGDQKVKSTSFALATAQSELTKTLLLQQENQSLNFDTLNLKQTRIVQLYNQLLNQVHLTPQLHRGFTNLKDSIQQQSKLIERLKPLISTIQNSERFIPTAIQKCAQTDYPTGEYQRSAQQLITQQLMARINVQNLPKLEKQLATFQKSYPNCQTVIAHTQILLKHYQKQSNLLTPILNLPIQQHILSITEEYERQYNTLLATNQQYNYLLLLITFLSFAYIIYTLFRVLKLNQSLEHTMNELEVQKNIYHAISEATQAIRQLPSEAAIYQKLTDIIHSYVGIPSCWVGVKNSQTQRVIPIAISGIAQKAIQEIKISTDPENPYSIGPVGTVFSQQKATIINDYAESQSHLPWYPKARALGLESMAVFPIKEQGQTIAALSLYSRTPNFFTEKNLELIQELIEDIESGIHALKLELVQKQQQQELALSAIAFNSQESIFITDETPKIIRVNQAFCDLTGYQPEEVIGHSPTLLCHGRSKAKQTEALWNGIFNQQKWQGEIWARKKNGQDYLVYQTISPVRDSEDNISHYIAHAIDLTQHKEAEQQLLHIQYFDQLTDLPNREQLLEKIHQALENHQACLLLFFNIHRFKVLNETLGHEIADLVLKQTAKRLQTLDLQHSRNHLLARLGGDEFAFLLPKEATDNTQALAHALAENISLLFANPIHIQGEKINIDFNIGATEIHPDIENAKDALQQADIALSYAKQSSQNALAFFNAEMQSETLKQRQLEIELQEAVETQAFEIHYQPQIDSYNEVLIGVEALIRWRKPNGELVPPGLFIATLEETGLIVQLSDWLLQQVIQDMQSLHQQTGLQPTCAINLSAIQFTDDQLAQKILQQLQQANYPTDKIAFEVTESILMNNLTDVINTLKHLYEHNIQIAIDDFGTGYSSLAYLKNLPINKLKIDKSFIDEIQQPKDLAIVKTIIKMTHSLGITCIAEGVETETQLEILEELGCEEIQGYYYSRPLPLPDLINYAQHYDNRS